MVHQYLESCSTNELVGVVDISDLAAFIGEVRSGIVFRGCLEHAKLKQTGSGYQLMLTNKNWDRVNDTDVYEVSASQWFKQIIRRQRILEKNLESTMLPKWKDFEPQEDDELSVSPSMSV